jgi:hypothetical protein
MQRHYCLAERCWLDFEEICSWCEITEEQAKETSDEQFRAIIQRLNDAARPEINDD